MQSSSKDCAEGRGLLWASVSAVLVELVRLSRVAAEDETAEAKCRGVLEAEGLADREKEGQVQLRVVKGP